MKLYEISEQLERLLMLDDGNAVDEETGELFSPEQLDELNMAFEEKIEGCLLFVKNQTAEAEAIKKEVKALQERARACENRAERTKNYVANFLAGQKFASSKVSVSYRNSTSCVVNIDATQLPVQFQKVKVEPDKTGLKEFIKAGNTIAGVELVNKKNMVIK